LLLGVTKISFCSLENNKVDQIVSFKYQNPWTDITKLEKIDLLVYQLYDLTEKEIEIIEGN